MSEDYSEARLRFAYLFPEFARPDFKLPGEEYPKKEGVKEFEWAELKALFEDARRINAENDKVDTKGNKLMDEELFTEEAIKRLTEPEGAAPRNSGYYESLVVDIETYTNHALKLQMAIVMAEAARDDACQNQREAKAALDDARAKLLEHLGIVRGTHVTLRKGHHE